MKAEFTNYFDVWGNKKDGWEVNNLCVRFVADIEPCEMNDRDLLRLLKAQRFLKKECRTNQLLFDWVGPDMVEIGVKRDLYPLGRFYFYENDNAGGQKSESDNR